MEIRRKFLNDVISNIRSKEAKDIISQELNHHISETKRELIQQNVSPDSAEEKAIQQMGNPFSLGKKLDKIHRPKVDWTMIGLFVIIIGLSYLPLWVLHDWIIINYNGKMIDNMVYKTLTILVGSLIGVGLMFLNYSRLQRIGWGIFLVGILILVFAHFPWMTKNINGVPHISVGPLSLDTATMVLPLFLVAWAVFFQNPKFTIWMYFFLLSGSLCLFIFRFYWVSTVIYLILVTTMLWFSKMNRKCIIIAFFSTWISVIGILVTVWFRNAAHLQERILVFLHPEKYEVGFFDLKIKELLNDAAWFGSSLSREKLIPHVHTDYVFAALTYSLGWFFSISLIILLSLILIRMSYILTTIKDPFGKLILVGCITLFTVPFVYNIGMTFGVFPILPKVYLPFISYGTLPVIINSIIIGLVLSVYRRKNLTINRGMSG